MKEEKERKIYDAGDYLPQTVDTLLAPDEDTKHIIIDQFMVNVVDGNAKLWIGGEEYFTASKYIIETLQQLDASDIKFPFRINLIRKESKEGNIYYDLRP